MVGMVSEGWPFYVALLLGAARWLFIGAIGWRTVEGKMSRLIAALGGLLSCFSAFIGEAFSLVGAFKSLIENPVMMLV